MALWILLKKRNHKTFSRKIKVKKYRSRTAAVKEARRIFGKDWLIKSVKAKNVSELRRIVNNRNI